MGLQKTRADKAGEKQANGATPWFAHWMGGPTLSLVRDCPIENTPEQVSPRTVYITGESDTWFSTPAACKYKGRTIRGYVTTIDDDTRSFVFRAHNDAFKANS